MDALEELHRQYHRVDEAQDDEFLREFSAYRQLLDRLRGLRQITRRLQREARDVSSVFERRDEELVPEIVQVKQQLVSTAPDLDDSQTPPPAGRRHDGVWERTLANFDAVADSRSDAAYVHTEDDRSRSGQLLKILEGRIYSARWFKGTGHASVRFGHAWLAVWRSEATQGEITTRTLLG